MSSKLAKAVVGAVVLGALVAAVAVVNDSGSNTAAGPESAVGGHVAGDAPVPRTVLVSSDHMPAVSQPGAPLHTLRVSGPVPRRPQAATVLTDEDCAANARGVSRCLNRIRLADGETLTVRHPHRMMDVPCLSPGERVRVRRA